MTVPKNLCHFFHLSGSGSAQDDGNLKVLRSSCGSKFSLGVEDTLHPNRGQEYRRLELVAEESCLGTKCRHSNRHSKETGQYLRTRENKGGGSAIIRTNFARDFRIGLSGSERTFCRRMPMSGWHPNIFAPLTGADTSTVDRLHGGPPARPNSLACPTMFIFSLLAMYCMLFLCFVSTHNST